VQPAGKVEIGPVPPRSATSPSPRTGATRSSRATATTWSTCSQLITTRSPKLTGRSPRASPLRPVHHPDGRWAVVANIGRGTGDSDTVSLIDLGREPVAHRGHGQRRPNAEGIQASPDGRFAAVTVMNGSNKPAGSPFHGPGLVRMLGSPTGAFPPCPKRGSAPGRKAPPFRPTAAPSWSATWWSARCRCSRVRGRQAHRHRHALGVSGGSAALRTVAEYGAGGRRAAGDPRDGRAPV
jgi:hypothetical protein